MKTIKKRIWLGAFAVLLVTLIAYGFWPKPVAVELATVSRGPLQATINEDGKTRIKERYVVSMPLSGRIHRVELRAGDMVEAGKTVVTTIEPTDPELLDPRSRAQAEARVKSAETARQQAVPSLERARTAYEFAKTELERAKRLYASETLSHQELDNAEQKERTTAEELKSSQFALQIAEFELELARAALLRTYPKTTDDSGTWSFEIFAPITGRVLRVFQESSAVVPLGAHLLELGDPNDLEVEIDVLSADAVKIKSGAKVLLEHWGGEAPLLGRVRLVEPAAFLKISALGVEEQRVNVIVDFIDPLAKRAGLGDAYRAEARIVVWEGANVLKVPAMSLFREADNWAVFAVQNHKATLRRVEIGHRNDREAEVLNGLTENVQVIVHPSDKVTHGVNVRVR